MNAVPAIALLAFRTALRSRVILVLLILLLLAGFLLPMTIRSDGTPEGLIRIHLIYTLGTAGFLLMLATLWAGCAALSREAEDKTIQMMLVKPVPRLSIWLGKWLALLVINGFLLVVVGLSTLFTLHMQLKRSHFPEAALFTARQSILASLVSVTAPLPDIDAEVKETLKNMAAKKEIPPNLSEEEAFRQVRRNHLAQLYAVSPGHSRTWQFHLEKPTISGGPVLLQYACDSSVPGVGDLEILLALHAGDFQTNQVLFASPGSRKTLLFTSLSPDIQDIQVEITNRGTHDATLFFDPEEGVLLRQPEGTFGGNISRALLELYLRLALFAAIGVTLGTLFSMPVATFLSLVLVIILQLSGFVSAAAQTDRADFVAHVAPFSSVHSHSHNADTPPEEPSLAAKATANLLYAAYRITYLTLRPLLEDRTLEDLSTGTRIPLRRVLAHLLQEGIALPLLLALLSTAVLHRREWGLPVRT